MAKEFAKAFYNSPAWRKCRKAYIDKRILIDGGLCEVCHERLGYIVHHIKELTPQNINDENITLSFDNLQYDCKHCHDREEAHAFIKQDNNRICFDVNGQPIPPKINDTV